LLLDMEANIEVKDEDGWTPLIYAVEKGHVTVMRLLLDAKADREAKDKDGRTPYLCSRGACQSCAVAAG
jgi:ankyrin repeat protein